MFLFSTYAIVIPIYMDLRVSHRFDICNETICSSLAAFFMLPLEFLFVTFIEFSNNFSHIFYVSFVCHVFFFSFCCAFFSRFCISVKLVRLFFRLKLKPETDVFSIFSSFTRHLLRKQNNSSRATRPATPSFPLHGRPHSEVQE